MNISLNLFEAFLKCPTKCWLLATGEPTSGNSYAEWIQAQKESFRSSETNRWLMELSNIEFRSSPLLDQLKTAKWKLSTNVVAQTPELGRKNQYENLHSTGQQISSPNSQLKDQNLIPLVATTVSSETLQSAFVAETCLHGIEHVHAEGRGKASQLIPIRSVFFNKISKDDRLLIAFDAFVLSAALGRKITVGKIIYGKSHATVKVKTSALICEVRKRLDKITMLLSSSGPPDLVLLRICAECEFQFRCRQIAIEKDDLSLLASMSDKERKKLRNKGIFTVTQLSYTFRPRRRPKRLRDKKEKYHHSLKALAIREKKIHIVGCPEVKIEGTPVYLDVEGLPDCDSYYLIGVRIGTIQHSLWADSKEEEWRIWWEFLTLFNAVDNPVLIHYGSYETTFLKRMCESYGKPSVGSLAAMAIQGAINLLSIVYAQVYFPTFSNGLKEIAGYLGFRWSVPGASGVQTIGWRNQWLALRDQTLKRTLLTYNAEDCEALETLTHKLIELLQESSDSDGSVAGVVRTARMKREHPYGFKRNVFAFQELETINNAAYWDYQRERVYVKSNGNLKRVMNKPAKRKERLSPNKTIECPRPDFCPKCGSTCFFVHGKAKKTIFDLKFMRHGLKRWITCYQFHRYKCFICNSTFFSKNRCWTRSKFGDEISAFALYQVIELRLPQEHVAASMNRLFGFNLDDTNIGRFKAQAAKNFKDSYDTLVKRLCSGRLLHADETKASVKDNDGFVWVFANMEEVVYVYSKTREGDLTQALLKNFTGVLVSDFYAAYDAIQCPQQKCLIHLIRDLNDDVLKHPYDEELKAIVLAFTVLLKPMVETVDRYGLKRRFLRKHLVPVDRFFRQLSDLALQSETAIKSRDRFQKNRDKLFTFLTYDGVPWNNNNAEHAIKPFAKLRHIIGGVTTEKGIQDYLVLLSLCETCKYMRVDFLDFLRSGEKDIHAFAQSRHGHVRRTPSS